MPSDDEFPDRTKSRRRMKICNKRPLARPLLEPRPSDSDGRTESPEDDDL